MKSHTKYRFLIALGMVMTWVTLLWSASPCPFPAHVELIPQSKDKALISWEEIPGGGTIEIAYGIQGSSPGESLKKRTRKTFLELKDLKPGTVYTCYGRPSCKSYGGDWQYLGEFTTYEENTLVIRGQSKSKNQAVQFEVPKGYRIDYVDIRYSMAYDDTKGLAAQRSKWSAPGLNRSEEIYHAGIPSEDNKLHHERKALDFLRGVRGKVALQPVFNAPGSHSLDWSNFELVVYLQDRGTCYVAEEMGFSPVFGDRAFAVWNEEETVEEWQLEYGLLGFIPGSGTLVTTANQELDMTGLSPLTQYEVRIRARCPNGEWDEWSDPFVFQTTAEMQMRVSNTLVDGAVEDLDSEFEDCIALLAVQVPVGYYIVDTRVEYALTAANGGWKSQQFSRIFRTDTGEGDTAYTQGQGEEEGTASYLRENIDWLNGLTAGSISLDARRSFSTAGDEGCNTFNQKVNRELWQVTVNYQPLPTCPTPSDFVLESVDLNSATLSWDVGEEVQSWDLEWGLKGFEPGQGTLVENLASPQYSWTDLLRNADYEVYLRARCSGEESFWTVEPFEFATLAGASLKVSYTLGDFPSDDQTPSSCRPALNFEIADEFVVQSFDLKYAISAQNNSGGPEKQRSKLLFPSLGLEEDNFFQGQGEEDGLFFYQRLGLDLITGRNGSFLAELDLWRTASSSGFEGCSMFNQKLEENTWELTLYLDPTCGAAEEVEVASFTENSATLSMKVPSNTERIELEYALPGFALGEGINTLVELDAEGQFVLGGLLNSTEYEFYIQTFCTNGLESGWIGPFLFETAPEPCTPTLGFEVLDLTLNSALLGWSDQGALFYEIEYGEGDFAQGTGIALSTSDNFIQIEDLIPGIRYTAIIRTVCLSNNFSPWSQPLDFTTLTEFSQTFLSGDLPSDTQIPSSCAALMTLTIPEGYEISGIDVEYQMTSRDGALILDQLSRVFSPTAGQGEQSYSAGIGGNPETFAYSRKNLDFLNGFTGEVELGLEALRSPNLGMGCSDEQVFVVQNSFKVKVFFRIPPPPVVDCNPEQNLPITNGNAFINFGSSTFGSSFRNITSYSLGEPVVGETRGLNFSSLAGFWGRLVLPPKAPMVMASQGEFPDRIEVVWNVDPLSPAVDDAFVILRNNSFLAQVDPSIRQFLDFNVQAGEFYDYEVLGRSQFGIGNRGSATGFVNPNGLITGKIETRSRNPVGGVVVRMSPTEGKSLAFNGEGDHLCISALESMDLSKDWTLSLWINNHPQNTQGSVLLDLGSDLMKNLRLETLNEGPEKGWRLLFGDGGNLIPVDIVDDVVKDNQWMQLTVVRSGQMIKAYLDGNFISAQRVPQIAYIPATLNVGCDRLFENHFKGNLDELRFFNRALNSQEIFTIRDITLSSQFEGLVGYWKFDEGFGEKVFDLSSSKNHAFRNGPTFSNQIPDISNSGITDGGGFYAIEGINYANNSSFKVRPTSFFATRSALEFDEAKKSRAVLTAFALPDSATLEMIVYPYELMQKQTLLSHGQTFDFFLENGLYQLKLGSNQQALGEASRRYEHVSLLLDFSQGEVQFYKDGLWVSTVNYPLNSFDFSQSAWLLGALDNAQPIQVFNGLVDEIAFYQGLLSQGEIEENVQNGASSGNGALIALFPLDEGSGAQLNDFGPNRTGMGQVQNAHFVSLAQRQSLIPRTFRPAERAVTLNNSQTSSSGIDFVDESLITLNGVVRFENTFCYQDSVEILVNGQSFFPRVFTDSEGRFSIDIEPGSSVILTPRYQDHIFFPGSASFSQVFRPVAGILFVNTTKHTLKGQMAGNEKCRLSIIPPNAIVKVKLAATDDCFEREITLDNTQGTGFFEFANLPPMRYTIAVTEHSIQDIKNFFETQGGNTIDLRNKKIDTANFIYRAGPNVEIQPFDETICANNASIKVIDQSTQNNGFKLYKNDIRVFENYHGGNCYLDTFTLTIDNEIGDLSPFDVVVKSSVYTHEYYAGIPNILGDYTKKLEVTALVENASATSQESVIVLGERSNESTFTTATPEMPLLILRDPPGDGSFSEYEKSTTKCYTWSEAELINTQGGTKVTASFGPKIATYQGSPFFGVINTADQKVDLGFSTVVGNASTNGESATVCHTFEQRIQTSDGEGVFYGDADLYMGAAINFEFSSTDVIYLNPNTCSIEDSIGVRIWPEGFKTTFVYSEWQIKNSVIPSLELNGDLSSANQWRKIIQRNKDLKDKAIFKKNISFDALNVYSEKLTLSEVSSDTESTVLTWEQEFNSVVGFNFAGIGTEVEMSFKVSGEISEDEEWTDEESTSVGFTLADNDIGDNFSVDILEDPVYKTTVFKLRAGESKCPWEPGTLNREEVDLRVDRNTLVNVPTNGVAVFRLTLGNLSPTGRDFNLYELGVNNNPNGAIIAVDGSPLINPLTFFLGPKETKEVLLTVTRGPVGYDFPDLEIYLSSVCQAEHSEAVGYDLGGFFNNPGKEFQAMYRTEDLQKFYKEVKLNVSFIEPCSPINISSPQQDWVIIPSSGGDESLFITLNNYLAQDPALELIRVQYRRTGGDGAWINIEEIPKEALSNPLFHILTWDMSSLSDGPYEIRAVTQCFDVTLAPGISEVVRGRKETQPPAVFGIPQPSNGILNRGDEISIQFSKRINCNKIFKADGLGTNINLNNIALLDMTEGGTLVDFELVCSEDKLVLLPQIQWRFIENHVLRAVVDGIEDLYGNATGRIEWEFLVNQSALYWEGGLIQEKTQEGQPLSVSRTLRNQGAFAEDFALKNIPSWMNVFPRQGTVQPGQTLPINFSFPSELLGGKYQQTIIMEGKDGDKPLDVNLRVFCEAPDWNIQPNNFDFSMNLTLRLNIEGSFSEDELDRVGAFVNGELRGVGQVEYNPILDDYFVFLTVYSNQSVGEILTFQIWHAEDCILYGETAETFVFVGDGNVGSPSNPQTLHTTGSLFRKVYFNPGWNWFSYNVSVPDSSVNGVMSTLKNPEEGLVKGQVSFSVYSEALNGWIGNLTTLNTTAMYQYKASAVDSIVLIGPAVFAESPIALQAGWNWIGYLPLRSMPISAALESLSPSDGDIIKSQRNFAQYVQGFGWVGNLRFMAPLSGYLLKISSPSTLIYPSSYGRGSLFAPVYVSQKEEFWPQANRWDLNPADYEFSMNAIALVRRGAEENILEEGDEVAAFFGEEVRGVSRAFYLQELDSYLLFMTLYANQEGEALSFKYFNDREGWEGNLKEIVPFSANQVLGSVVSPFEFNMTDTQVSVNARKEEKGISLQVFPNPASEWIYCKVHTQWAEPVEITLYDLQGRALQTLTKDAKSGNNVFEWSLGSDISSGVYIVKVSNSKGSQSQILSIQK